MVKKRKIILFGLFFLVSNVSLSLCDGLSKQISGLLSAASQRKVLFGVKIIDAESGKLIYAHNAKKALMPASNMKVVTTAAAVRFLGIDFEYVTQVGLADGNIVVIGSGDPLFGDAKTDAYYGREPGWVLDDIVEKLKGGGVSSVNDIIIDSSVFDDERAHLNWPADQLNRWYACEVCGVNYNDNCVEMTVRRSGNSVKIDVNPATGFLKLKNEVRITSSSNEGVGAYRIAGKPNNLVVRGKCRSQQGPFDVAIERPAVFFGYLLYEKLTAEGIRVGGKLVERDFESSKGLKSVCSYRTPLLDCLKRANKDSLGLSAESLVKTIAYRSSNERKGGSWGRGTDLISGYLSGLGVEKSEFFIDDGSGLSRENRLSANALCSVLFDIYKKPQWPDFKSSLSIGGVDGTAGKHFTEAQYKGKVFGKTGYISGVKSFSGFCAGEKGNYIFSIIANNANSYTRKVINDIVKTLIDER